MADEQHGLQWDYNNGGLDPGEPTSINTISRAFLSTVTRCTVGLTLGLGPNIRDSGAKPRAIPPVHEFYYRISVLIRCPSNIFHRV
ncbi:hypothetical protein WN51_02981 [Melipona quadrifasciata]|uniref:Uncharacterized protein n=1 Tax=Melipona quadrifasciata TaxID=166423 RepID=A0A0M8ZX37_9HYME|nr:hypothetical protein WN51_02981 [Melipona quadrifasciata]